MVPPVQPVTPAPASAHELRLPPNPAPLLAVARRILGCGDLAWDAVQEAMIALWQEDPPPPDPRSWLTGAVVNRSLHHLRTLGRRRTHECRAARSCEWSVDPGRRLERGELRERLNAALSELAPEFWQALLLHELAELDYVEIARLAQVPVGTVRSRIHRAKRRLRELLAQQGVDELDRRRA